jgi:N-acetyl-gamma-glutamyl-phosphate reductase
VLGHEAAPLEQVEGRWRDVELVFSCLPHGVSAPVVERARQAGARVVDLSADLRLSDRAVYGLTEFARPALPDAPVVANPGCYPTGALLALLPFARAGVVDPSRPIVIDAASGVSGAGRSAKRELLFAEVAEDFRAYAVGNAHRHLPEITGQITPVLGPADVIFTPHLLPVRRGILSTVHVPVREPLTRQDGERILSAAYGGEPCVQLRPGSVPSLRDVVHRNRVAIGVVAVQHVARPMLTVISAIDNLVKGAAGQAVQNMNAMQRWPETRGLLC